MKNHINRKAVSPVIAVILLVAVTVGIVAGAFAWITSIQTPAQEKGSELAGRQVLELSGKLKIESVNANSSTTSTIYFRNVGAVVLSNFTLYLDGNSANETTLELDKGQLGNITTDLIDTAGKTYQIRIVSVQGASAVKSVIAE